jgi:Ca2+-transporting ATPase
MLVTVCAIVVGALNLIAGRGAETSLVLAISLAVAAIPESLPAVVSLSLAMAARRMAARGVLARRLSAVEALGSVTVIASDKTGTLTEGRMAVADMWLAPDSSVTATELLEAAVLCSDACNNAAGTPGERDDPTEIALVDAARDVGIDVAALRDRFARIDEIPFDATTKFMQTTHRAPSGDVVIMRKGSPEVLTTDWPAAREGRRVRAQGTAGSGRYAGRVGADVPAGPARTRGPPAAGGHRHDLGLPRCGRASGHDHR